MRSFDASGKFWTEGKKETNFDARLEFDLDEGIKLRTTDMHFHDDKLKDLYPFLVRTSNPIAVGRIFGYVNGIGEVTLLDCYSYSSFFGNYADTIRPKFLLVGGHFEGDIYFDSLRFRLTNLSDWAYSKSIVSEKQFFEKDSDKYSKTELILENVESVSYQFDEFEMKFHFGGSFGWEGIKNYRVVQDCSIEIIPAMPQEFDTYLDSYLFPLRQFIDFGTDRHNRVVDISGAIKLDDNKQKVEIYYVESEPINPREKRNIQAIDDLVFGLGDIEETFVTQYSRWLKKREDLSAVIQLYLTTVHEQMYLDMNFLLLTQALEAYHRIAYGGQYLSDEKYDEIVKILMGSLPSDKEFEEFCEKFADSLKYGNEYSQRTRFKKILNEVLKDLDAYLTKLIGNKKARKGFVFKVVETRNSLTHHSKETILKGRELSKYVGKLGNILLACLLLELEIPPTKIVALLERNRVRRNWAV